MALGGWGEGRKDQPSHLCGGGSKTLIPKWIVLVLMVCSGTHRYLRNAFVEFGDLYCIDEYRLVGYSLDLSFLTF